MALSRSQFESPAWFRFDRSAGSSTSPAPPVTTASVRSPFRDEALEDDGRAASSGDDLHQNVETKRTHNRNNSIDSIDLRSLFGSPSLPSTQVFSPLPSRPLTPLVATAPAQQSQPSDPLLPSPKPAKPPVKRESGGTNNAKPRMVKNKKLQRILNGQKPPRERKDPLQPVLFDDRGFESTAVLYTIECPFVFVFTRRVSCMEPTADLNVYIFSLLYSGERKCICVTACLEKCRIALSV